MSSTIRDAIQRAQRLVKIARPRKVSKNEGKSGYGETKFVQGISTNSQDPLDRSRLAMQGSRDRAAAEGFRSNMGALGAHTAAQIAAGGPQAAPRPGLGPIGQANQFATNTMNVAQQAIGQGGAPQAAPAQAAQGGGLGDRLRAFGSRFGGMFSNIGQGIAGMAAQQKAVGAAQGALAQRQAVAPAQAAAGSPAAQPGNIMQQGGAVGPPAGPSAGQPAPAPSANSSFATTPAARPVPTLRANIAAQPTQTISGRSPQFSPSPAAGRQANITSQPMKI